MKKIFLLLSIVSVFGLTGCNNDDIAIPEQRSEVFEVDNVNFLPDINGVFSVLVPLDPTIKSSDVVLVYRLRDSNNFGHDIWESIPTDYNLPEGRLSYYFDFSQDDVVIYLESEFNPATRPEFSSNQIFRIVLVPGYVAETIDNKDFDTVMNAISQANESAEIKTIK